MMRNYKSSFERTGEISREPNQRTGWLDVFAEKLAIQESTERVKTASRQSTAVEVARTRYNTPQPSVYEMMSSIISAQKPKFSSVDEAVKHYQESTGLAQYLKAQKKNDVSALATVISQAGSDVVEFPKNKSFGARQMSWLVELVEQFAETDDMTSEERKIVEHIAENGSTEMDEKLKLSPRELAQGILDGDEDVFSMVVSGPDDDSDGPGGAGAEGVFLEVPFEEIDEAATDDPMDDPMDDLIQMKKRMDEKRKQLKKRKSEEFERCFHDLDPKEASLNDVFHAFYARGSKKKV
jgi:hypothetical protein